MFSASPQKMRAPALTRVPLGAPRMPVRAPAPRALGGRDPIEIPSQYTKVGAKVERESF